MTNFQVKSAIESDVPQIIAMLRDFAEFEKLSEYCEITAEKLSAAMFGENPCIECLMAFDAENKAVGYALFYQSFASFRGERGAYLEDLYVAPETRKSGVGLALLKELARVTKARGGTRIDFQVLTWNERAINFYQKLGAEINDDERHFRFADSHFDALAQ